MPKLLTKRKAAWIGKRKPDVVRGSVLNYPAGVADRYQKRIERLIEKMIAETERKIERLFNGEPATVFFAEDASVSSQARILTNALTAKFDSLFGLYAKPLAEQMAQEADEASKSGLYSSIKELSGGMSLKTDFLTLEMKDVLSATITENVGLIKSIPKRYLTNVQGAVMRSITTGNGLADLKPFLDRYKAITQKRASLIANDQTRKAYAFMNKGRMESLKVPDFEWIHSHGGNHPRKLHQQYDGKIFSLRSLPVIDERTGERGIPGQLINCKCKMRPIIKFEEVTNAG